VLDTLEFCYFWYMFFTRYCSDTL